MTVGKPIDFDLWLDRLNKPEPNYLWERPNEDYWERPVNPLSVIKFNSTFLELCDIRHTLRGTRTLIALGWALLYFTPAAAVAACLLIIRPSDGRAMDLPAMAGLAVILLITLLPGAVSFWIFKKGVWPYFFGLTHHPVRLNRRSRTVYFIGDDGRAQAASWDREAVFNAGNAGLTGTVVREDPETENLMVRGRFTIGAPVGSDIYGLWEFIRRYMDEDDGPAALAGRVGPRCLPLADGRESRLWAWKYVGLRWTPARRALMAWFLIPAFLLRAVSSATCRRPVWPPEIEDDCRLEPGDPLVRDEHGNPPLKWSEPLADWAAMAEMPEDRRAAEAEKAGFLRRVIVEKRKYEDRDGDEFDF